MLNQLFASKNKSAKDKKLIIIIGFNKTGTTSIHRLFQHVGLRSVHWDEGKLTQKMYRNALDGRPILEGYDAEFDVFSDLVYRTETSWFEGNTLFRQIDQDYSNAYFIYNTRDIDDWLESRANHKEKVGEQTVLDLHKRILDTEDIETVKSYWRQFRLRFEEDIRSYFADKSNLLEIAIDDPDFVSKLSAFVSMELPPSSWKQYNKT